MKNFKIKHKIIIGFLTVFLLFSSNFFLLIYNNYNTNKNITDINKIKVKNCEELINIQKNIIKISEIFKDIILHYDQEKENEALELYNNVTLSLIFIETNNKTEGKISDADNMHTLIEEFKNFYNLGYEMIVLFNAGNTRKSEEIHKKFDIRSNELLNILEIEFDKKRTELSGSFEQLKKKSRLYNNIAYFILFISMIIIIFVIIIIIKSITKNVSQLINVTNKIEKGDLTQTVNIKAKDEIGILSNHFNSFIKNIKNIINNIKMSSEENITIKNNMISQTEQIENTLIKITSNLDMIQDKVNILNQNVSTTTTAIEQITRNIDSLDNQIENQSGAVAETSASISEMTASISNVARITNQKKDATAILLQKAGLGSEKINLTNSLIENITSSIDDILNMIKIINQIASQTELLSMNANIEAAHAGEAGKGFAVVADEIKNLAESAGENSNNIAKVLNRVVSSIKETSISSKETKNTFEEINQEINEVVRALDEIALTSGELSMGGEQIINAMSVLTETSSNVHLGSNEIIGSMHNINNINTELIKEINDIAVLIKDIKKIIGENLNLISHLNDITEKLNSQINDFKS